jgi:hypothetical protein
MHPLCNPTLTQWLQVDDEALLYTPDGTYQDQDQDMWPDTTYAQLRAAFCAGLLSGRTYIEACVALGESLHPATGRPVSLGDLGV